MRPSNLTPNLGIGYQGSIDAPRRHTASVQGEAPSFSLTTPHEEGWVSGFNLPGMDSSVQTLAFGPDSSLYAGGWFTIAGGVVTYRIARWNGTAWRPLGSGMNNTVNALALGPDGSVYAGGYFTAAGDVAASHIARWDDLPPTLVTLALLEAVTVGGTAASIWSVVALLGLALTAGAALAQRHSTADPRLPLRLLVQGRR